ncbi:MAG: DUF3108 domain-containing protein [Thermodesulfobacteriota bacterium]
MGRFLPALSCLFGVIGLLLFFSVANAKAEDHLPFEVGERITYQLKWGVIPAGKVVLEVLPHTTIDGRPARHFRMTIRSNGFIDRIYKVRSYIEGYTDLGIDHSLYYRKKQREGSSKRDIEVRFDRQKMTSQYHNLRKMGPRAPISIPEGSFDPFSVIYYCRLLDYDGVSRVERPVTDGKKSVTARLDNRGRQDLVIKDKSYDTYLLEPDIKHISGVFKKSKNANLFIWMSTDKRRIPVKLKSKVIVGSFTAEMISYQAK